MFAKRCRIDIIDLKAILENNKDAPLYAIIRIADVIGVPYINLFKRQCLNFKMLFIFCINLVGDFDRGFVFAGYNKIIIFQI